MFIYSISCKLFRNIFSVYEKTILHKNKSDGDETFTKSWVLHTHTATLNSCMDFIKHENRNSLKI